MRLRAQLLLLVLTAVVTVAGAALMAMRAITYKAFLAQERAQLSWLPFTQARQIRHQDLAHIGRLIATDATLVSAWRHASREIQEYSQQVVANRLSPEPLEALRQRALPSLWDIAQRLFLESDPGSDDIRPHHQDYAACADLFLLCDGQGVVISQSLTSAHGNVSVSFPLDPSHDPPPSRLRIDLPNASPYLVYADQLFEGVTVAGPAGVVLLGDRMDDEMVAEASRLTGARALLVKKGAEPPWFGAGSPTPQLLEVTLEGSPHLAACYPLGQQGWMVFLKSTAEVEAVARQQATVTVLLVLGAVGLALLVVLPLAQRIANPLLDLSRAMAEVGSGNLEARAHPQGPQEIAQAGQAFNHMVEGLRQKETLEKFVSKLESLRKAADPQDPLVRDQTQFGNHLVVQRIGSGGMASVYRALPSQTLDETAPIAIKVIHRNYAQDSEYQARFRREFELMQKLHHPGLVRVLEFGDLNGLLYIAMELVEGETLRQFLERKGPLDLATFRRLAVPILEALQAAHQAGVTHRDLKPENLMMTQDGIKIMDFGLATCSGVARLTLSGDTVGTPRYMAPEQMSGHGSEACFDQYSLGVVFYEMLAGVPPFQSENPMALILAHLSEPPPPLRDHRPDLAEAWEALILKMLSKDPQRRYPDLASIVDEFQRL